MVIKLEKAKGQFSNVKIRLDTRVGTIEYSEAVVGKKGMLKINFVYDKSSWPKGPWDGEPDFQLFQHRETKLFCLIRRNEFSGGFCGYVHIPKEHPLYGMNLHGIDEPYVYNVVAVHPHQGLTWAGPIEIDNRGEDSWWIGFDCNHRVVDVRPIDGPFKIGMPLTEEVSMRGTYKTFAFVRAETIKLAKQIRFLGR